MDGDLTDSVPNIKKRVAEDVPPAIETAGQPHNKSCSTPRIVRRHRHRHRNVAATVWDPDVSSTPNDLATAYPSRVRIRRFDIYKAILRHPNLFFQFALRLPYPTMIDLYAIDKEFHYRLNKYSVSLIHDYAKYHAPLAGYIFSWVLYPHLCISDPMLRPMDGRTWLARDVPGFRWVGMVLWRDKVVRSILTHLALEGHRVPYGCMETLMKFWVLMETKTTPLRRAFLHNQDIWADVDIINMHLFFFKLDMRFAHPILGNGICELSHLLLTQKSLALLWKVLAGKRRLDCEDIIDMVVRTYHMNDLDTATHPWLHDAADNGVPEEEWGLLSSEDWDVDGAAMDPAIDMVITEGIRRGLNVQQYYLDFVLYGYVDPETRQNVPIPTRFRKDSSIMLPGEGWPGRRLQKNIIESLEDRLKGHKLKAEVTMEHCKINDHEKMGE